MKLVEPKDIHHEVSIVEVEKKIGRELLFNISMLRNTYEQDLAGSSKKMSSSRQMMCNLTSDVAILKADLLAQTYRLQVLQNMKQEIVSTSVASRSTENEEILDQLVTLSEIKKKIPAEWTTFGLDYTIFNKCYPCIISAFESWIPLQQNLPQFNWWVPQTCMKNVVISPELDDLFSRVCELSSFDKVMKSLSTWNIYDPEPVVRMLEDLRSVYTTDKFTELVHEIFNILNRAVHEWKPENNPIYIHTWLHPWLQVSELKLDPIYPVIRRKLAKFLENWSAFDKSAHQIISPWSKVFSRASLNALIVKAVVPKLIVCANSDQEMSLECILLWKDLIPKNHMIAIIFGSYFANWSNSFIRVLRSNDNHNAAFMYIKFRSSLPSDYIDESNVFRIRRFLQGIEKYLESSNADTLSEISSILSSLSYELILKNQAQPNDFNFSHRNVAFSFKELVESFAESNNITFAPKDGYYIDGKQIWLFGNCHIYIEHDVVFSKNFSASNSWTPITLEELLLKCSSSAGN